MKRFFDDLLYEIEELFRRGAKSTRDEWRALNFTGKAAVVGFFGAIALLLILTLPACGPIQTGGSGDQHITNQTIITTSVTGSTTSTSSGGAVTGGTSYTAGQYYDFPTATKADWSTGTITFSITGLALDMLPASSDCIIFIANLLTPSGAEGNFHFNIASLVPRLTSQRFDGTCSPRCEHQSPGSVLWLATETYSFTFTWNASTVDAIVRDSGSNVVYSGSVATDGAYTGVTWVRVGNGIGTAGATGPITVINPVLK